MLFYNSGAIKAESCLWMGEEIIKGVYDGINTTALACVQPTAWRCNRDWSAWARWQEDELFKKRWRKFCRFNFVSTSWKSNLGVRSQDILGFLYVDITLCLRSAAARWDVFSFFPPSFDLFVCLFSSHSCTQDTDTKAELDHIQLWLSKADWIPKPISLQKGNRGKQKMSTRSLSFAFSFSSQFNCVTQTQTQIEWCDLLIHLKTSRRIFFPPRSAVRAKTKLSFDFLSKPNCLFKQDELGEGRVLSYWFLHISLKGMLCSCTNAHIMVSPRCILIGLLPYPGRRACSIRWQCSESRAGGRAHTGIDFGVSAVLVTHQCFLRRQIILKAQTN